jgi:hypothetical protein
MRSVRLTRNAFINDRYCVSGEVVDIGDHTALAPHMRLLPSHAPLHATVAVPVAAPTHTVVVHYHQTAHEVDIEVNGVEMRVDDAALKVDVI